MKNVSINVNAEEVLRELDIEDVIKFYTEKEVLSCIEIKNIVANEDQDHLLDEIDDDKIEDHYRKICEARD
jgi:hypothetical protein